MLVKICGITNTADGEHALVAGADLIGLNLVGGPRQIALPDAMTIVDALDAATRAVALAVVGDDGGFPPHVLTTLREHGVSKLQLYGRVDADTIRGLAADGLELISVHSIGGPASLDHVAELLRACGDVTPQYLLCDAAVAGKQGGTGMRADWGAIVAARQAGRLDGWPPLILAGGLTPENVSEAVRTIAPAGVDVSSGVESSPGRKDRDRVGAFVTAARAAAGEIHGR